MTKVKWVPTAVRSLEETLQFQESQWTEAGIKKFLKSLTSIVSVIETFPEGFAKIGLDDMRRAVLAPSKHHCLIYEYRNEVVWIILIWDGRRNPENLPPLLKGR